MNIYFNHSFTQTAKIAELLRNNPEKQSLRIVMTQDKNNKYLKDIADVFEYEPNLEGVAYIEYLLDVCTRHQINVFIPRKNMTLISQHRDAFAGIGVQVMLIGDDSIYTLLNDKVKTYQELEGKTKVVGIPMTYTITSLHDFKESYQMIRNEGDFACMKPIDGIGGIGFKRIVETMSPLEELYTTTSSISRERAEAVLAGHEEVPAFMMSAYLEGEEFSIDCLSKDGELIIGIPRKKIDRYRQTIEYRQELMMIAKELTKHYNLSYLYNIQVKYHKGLWYLIEINTRMSGGLYKSCLTGLNLPYYAVQLAMGQDIGHLVQPSEDMEVYSTNDFGVRPYVLT